MIEKKGILLFTCMLALSLIMINFVSATCALQASLINQDPYPAVPGDYVKLVFELQGSQNPDCKDILFQLMPEYPISFDPNSSSTITLNGGAFVNDYQSTLVAPFKVRIDENAVDGDTPIKVRYAYNSNQNAFAEQEFNLSIKDARTKFEAYVSNFDLTTNTLTIQILNSGKSNIDALTLEILPQPNVTVKGSNQNILGSLDANEYTTADFEVAPVNANITVNVYYTDKINVRRNTTLIVPFDPLSFENRKSQQKSSSALIWIVLIIIIIIIYFVYRSYKKRRTKKLHS